MYISREMQVYVKVADDNVYDCDIDCQFRIPDRDSCGCSWCTLFEEMMASRRRLDECTHKFGLGIC